MPSAGGGRSVFSLPEGKKEQNRDPDLGCPCAGLPASCRRSGPAQRRGRGSAPRPGEKRPLSLAVGVGAGWAPGWPRPPWPRGVPRRGQGPLASASPRRRTTQVLARRAAGVGADAEDLGAGTEPQSPATRTYLFFMPSTTVRASRRSAGPWAGSGTRCRCRSRWKAEALGLSEQGGRWGHQAGRAGRGRGRGRGRPCLVPPFAPRPGAPH